MDGHTDRHIQDSPQRPVGNYYLYAHFIKDKTSFPLCRWYIHPLGLTGTPVRTFILSASQEHQCSISLKKPGLCFAQFLYLVRWRAAGRLNIPLPRSCLQADGLLVHIERHCLIILKRDTIYDLSNCIHILQKGLFIFMVNSPIVTLCKQYKKECDYVLLK